MLLAAITAMILNFFKGGPSVDLTGGVFSNIAATLAQQEKVQRKQAAASKPARGKAKHYNAGGAADPRMNIVKPKAMEFSGAQGTPYKKGGKAEDRVARKSGGRATGKTNINIMIAAGKPAAPEAMQGAGGPPMPPGGIPVPLPGGAPGGAPPMPMGGGMGAMPMPPAPPAMPSPMARKTGGRTVAKSYKDMTAGSGSGEGRIQKTEIAEGKREARKAGGKVYRSYKDMDAGAGSGLGRLEKTEIEARKN